MMNKTFKLVASVNSDNPVAVRGPLELVLGAGAKIEPTDDGFRVEATLSGESAKGGSVARPAGSDVRHAVEELVVLVVPALAHVDAFHVLDELDGADPLDHLEPELVLDAQPEGGAM